MPVSERDIEIVEAAFATRISKKANNEEKDDEKDDEKNESPKPVMGACPGAKLRSMGLGLGLGRGRGRGPRGIPAAAKLADITKKGEALGEVFTNVIDVEATPIAGVEEALAAISSIETKQAAAAVARGKNLSRVVKLLKRMVSVPHQIAAGTGRAVAKPIGTRLARLPAPTQIDDLFRLAEKNQLLPVWQLMKDAPGALGRMAGEGIKKHFAGRGVAPTVTGAGILGLAGYGGAKAVGGGKKPKPEEKQSELSRVLEKLSAEKEKKEDEQKETKPGVVRLESASDTPPKKAPEKKPEEESENEVEYKKDSAYVSTPSEEMGLPVRGLNQQSTNRDAIFREVAKWSVGGDDDENGTEEA